ncbi:alpha/beta hydrolase [Pseudomonadota bacterium]
MWFVLGLLIIVAGLWIAGLWIGRSSDLSVFDQSTDPAGRELFSHPDGPSPEHQAAAQGIMALKGQVKGLSRKEMLQFTRDFMEDMPKGKTFSCEFRPVEVAGRPAEWVLARGVDPSRRVLYLHGGAFFAGSPNSHRSATCRFSEVANAAVLAIDYRLIPENTRKQGIEDCRAAYRWILENGPDGASAPSRLYIGGDSAGGNLSLSVTAWARDEALRPPDGVVALSPLTDSTYSGPSIRTNVGTDVMLGPMFGALLKIPKWILSWIFLRENRTLPADPVVSPVFDDLSGLPPILVQVSEAEMLLDDARRYVRKAREAGSPVRLQSWGGMLHVWQLFYPEVPEAREAWERIGEFIQSVETDKA